MASDSTHGYIARLPCGCAIGLGVDDPARARDTAKWVADWIRRGAGVTRLTIAECGAAWRVAYKKDACAECGRGMKKKRTMKAAAAPLFTGGKP